jgi:acyl-CoA synthetase (AMP-forming)/AMP-acid ligase II
MASWKSRKTQVTEVEPTRIFEAIEHWSDVDPDAEAVVYGTRRMSYGQLKVAMDRTAKAFLDFGVQPGDRIAMLAMACPEFLISWMAASKVGALWLGLNPKLSPREMGYILGDCRPRILITVGTYGDKNVLDDLGQVPLQECGIQKTITLGPCGPGFLDFDSAIDSVREDLDDQLSQRASAVQPTDPVLLMYTSGSTGQPKGVLQSHQSILSNVREQVQYFFMDRSTRALLHFPINHVAADVEIGFATMYVGGALVMMDRFDPAESLAMLARERITMFGQIPAMFLMQAALPNFSTTDFTSLKLIVFGGAAAPMPLLRTLQKICDNVGAKLVTGYGSTEACGFITYTQPGEPLERLATSVGRSPEGFELKIVDDQRSPLPAGRVGELAIRGPFLMIEYWNKPSATAESMDAEGWFYTGDLGFLESDGTLFLSGRKSEMYKTGGENVFPREIEDVLCEHPAVALAAVIGVPDPLYQEVGCALIVLRPGATAAENEIKEHCRDYLANFKVPKVCEIRKSLPMLANGKVNKLELKREFLSKAAQEEV